jgi:tetratricopeptide (TPR) repeat protein
MKVRNFVVAAAGTLLLAISSYAQITAIEGDVKGADGSPLVKAVVKITRTDIKGNYKCDTNKKGHYFYNGLPLGTYNIVLEVDGKEVDKVNGVRTRLGDPVNISFDMQKTAKENAARQQQMQAQVATGVAPTKEQERGMTKEQKEAMDKALKDREAAMKKNKELNDAFTAGVEALQKKEYDAAVESLNKASELDPKQVAVWANLAEAYVGAGSKKTGADFDATMAKGIDAYRKAIDLNPSDAATHNNFALALAKAKKFDETQKELQKAADLDPPKAGQYYYNLGALLTNSGQPEAAIEAFKKAIAADPNYAEAHYQYGIYLTSKAQVDAKTGKMTFPEGTAESFQKYLELKPDGANAASAKGMLETMGSTVSTTYVNPDAKKAPAKGGTTKKKN